MKPSRLARRFNKKGRQENRSTVREENSLSNVGDDERSIVPPHFVFPQVILENGTTTADNQSILPSKKKKVRRTNVDARQTKPIAKKKLSKKERKRLEKILQVKKKKAQVSSPCQQFCSAAHDEPFLFSPASRFTPSIE